MEEPTTTPAQVSGVKVNGDENRESAASAPGSSAIRSIEENQRSPLAEMKEAVDRIERWFERSIPQRFRGPLNEWMPWHPFNETPPGIEWHPQLEMLRRNNQMVIRTDLPGVEKEGIKVEVQDGLLTISGERKKEKIEEGEQFYRSERSYGKFLRSIPLPEESRPEEIKAEFNDGVLQITFPISETASARQISIE